MLQENWVRRCIERFDRRHLRETFFLKVNGILKTGECEANMKATDNSDAKETVAVEVKLRDNVEF